MKLSTQKRNHLIKVHEISKEWKEFIAKHSFEAGEVKMITVANYGYLDLILNLIHTLQLTNTKYKILVITYDQKLVQALSTYPCIPVWFIDEKLSSEAVAFKRTDWNSVTRFKLLAVWFVLSAGHPVFYVDPDIAFLRDPDVSVAELNRNKETDVWFQFGKPYCSGVIYARPGVTANALFHPDEWTSSVMDDETYLTHQVTKKNAIVKTLDRVEYPNGLYWKQPEEAKDIINNRKSVLFHFNYISGIDAKISRMREYNCYIETMRVVNVPKVFQSPLREVCIHRNGTAYPPHHKGDHLEEYFERLIIDTHKTRLIKSEAHYLPVHWTAMAVAGRQDQLISLRNWCNKLFTGKGKFFTLVQHCKGIQQSVGVEIPDGRVKIYCTSNPCHTAAAIKRVPAISVPAISVPATAATVKPQKQKRVAQRRTQRQWKRVPRPVKPPVPLLLPAIDDNHNMVSVQPVAATRFERLQDCITVPLVSSPHPHRHDQRPPRDLLTSFIGNLDIHPIRQRMARAMLNKERVIIKSGDYKNIDSALEFETLMLRSEFALCPRGFGTTSFRLSEAMEFGCIPVYISDVFSIPFTGIFPFEEICVLIRPDEIETLYDKLSAITDEKKQKYRDNINKHYERLFSLQGSCRTILREYIEKQLL